MTKKAVIDSFRNEFAFLSNFYPSIIYHNHKKWETVEHAYQASKTLDESNIEMIRKAKTPAAAKKLGQSVMLRKDWDTVKVNIMRELIRKKFENPFLRPMLLATEDAELIESNWWGDDFWGVDKKKGGKNMLGRLLMEIREEIRKEEASEPLNNG